MSRAILFFGKELSTGTGKRIQTCEDEDNLGSASVGTIKVAFEKEVVSLSSKSLKS
tara:strand:- start:174 stop:341 length:168 start_codon:yes stop_codon:yes gene_type:complete